MSVSWIWEGNLLQPGRRRGRARLTVTGDRIARVEWLSSGPGAATQGSATEGGLSGNLPVWRAGPEFWMLPGFVDGHTHLIGAGLKVARPDLSAARSKKELLELLAAWLEQHPGDGMVFGVDWDQSLWADPAWPTRAELDLLAPARPLCLRRVCGHVAVLNSAALGRTGIEWPDLDPESGLAREALPLALPRLFPPTSEETDAALAAAQEQALGAGITGIQEMGALNSFRAFARAQAAGRLRLRVSHFFGRDALPQIQECGLVPGLGGDWLRVGGIKIFLDGSLGGRSAAVRQPYPGEGGLGLLLLIDEELQDILSRASAGGYQTAMHAIGDRACGQAIETVESLRRAGVEFPAPGPRLEHAEMLDAPLLERAVRAGFLISMQPNFTARWQGSGGLYEQVLGSERALRLNLYRSVAATGRLLFGSDTMPLGPHLGLRGATGHPDAGERLSFDEAARAYTEGAARAVTHPFAQGTAEEGSFADLTVLEVPPQAASAWETLLSGGPAEWPEGVRTAATMTGGVVRFTAPPVSPPEGVPR